MQNSKKEYIPKRKLIVIGDSGVGKTSIITKFSTLSFKCRTESTIGVIFLKKEYKLKSDKKIEFQVLVLVNRFGTLLDNRNIDQ